VRTAQLPDLYQPGPLRSRGRDHRRRRRRQALHGDRVTPGDQYHRVRVHGLHTNGYTLARKIVFD
jgi:phosphoribosylaminoimidazole (AIR) synthetase